MYYNALFNRHNFTRYDYGEYSARVDMSGKASNETLQRLQLKDESLVKINDMNFHVIRGGKRHYIREGALFYKYAWKFSDVKLISPVDLMRISVGDPMAEIEWRI